MLPLERGVCTHDEGGRPRCGSRGALGGVQGSHGREVRKLEEDLPCGLRSGWKGRARRDVEINHQFGSVTVSSTLILERVSGNLDTYPCFAFLIIWEDHKTSCFSSPL